MSYTVFCHKCAEPLESSLYSAGQLKKKRPHCKACATVKYGNQAAGGHQSKLESRRAQILRGLENNGVIRDLKLQVRYELIPKQDGERPVHYIADAVYLDDRGEVVVEDSKGFKTKEYVIKKKLMLFRYGIRIQEVA